MNNTNYQQISINELVNALQEELELENPCIPAEEKFLLGEFMAWDIFHRGEYEPLFDPPKSNLGFIKSLCYNKNTLSNMIRASSPKNKEIILV